MLTIKLALMALARPIVRLIVKSNSCLAFLAVNRGVDLVLSHFYRTFIALLSHFFWQLKWEYIYSLVYFLKHHSDLHHDQKFHIFLDQEDITVTN